MLLHEIIELAATDRPDDTAIVFEGRRLTFAELDRRIRAMTRILTEVVEPGDRVVIVSDNHFDVVTSMYAVPATGAILAFGNTRHTPDELLGLVAVTEPVALIASPTQLDRLTAGGGPAIPVRGIFAVGGPHPGATVDLTELLDDDRAEDLATPGHTPSAGDCAWLIHTSGTTGAAKGVMLTHESLGAAVANSAVARPLAEDDVYLFPFPLFHVAAYNVLHAHLRRRPVVLVPKFDAAAVLALVESERVTSCSLAPTMIAMLLDHGDDPTSSLSTLRQISYGASSMPLDLLRRVLQELPDCGLAQGYGMTELSGNAVFLSPEAHRRAATDSPHLLAAAGRPGPLVAVKVVDDDGRAVEPGATGEILVRGDQVCAGYWNDPASTADSRSGAWLHTGDIGRIDEDGQLYVVDRLKDIIITGGENVASREVEDVMSEHPHIAQIAVVGLPDDRWGEIVCAVVVPVAGAPFDPVEVVAWSEGRLAGFKRPRTVVTVPELPLNASGKVDKRVVRQVVRERAG